jgi:hypothetical protein
MRLMATPNEFIEQLTHSSCEKFDQDLGDDRASGLPGHWVGVGV